MKKNFRFFDNRQKYLLFVTTTNEKNKIADALRPIVQNLKPHPKKKSPTLALVCRLGNVFFSASTTVQYTTVSGLIQDQTCSLIPPVWMSPLT